MSKSKPPAVPKNANDNGAYNVGYGKPPTHTKYAKGKSGNPSGRPKGSKNNMALTVQDVFGQTVSVGVNGKNKKVALLHAMVTKVAAMAMTGDPAAMKIALNLCSTFCLANDNSDLASGSSFELTAEQTEAISKSGLLKGLK